MKAIKVFENASVLSVNNGEITLKLENGIAKYYNASLTSVCDGRIEIVVNKKELEMEDLQTGMVVQYEGGEYCLVIRVHDKLVKLAGMEGRGSGYIFRDCPILLTKITKVWEPRIVGSIDKWFRIDPDRKVIFER